MRHRFCSDACGSPRSCSFGCAKAHLVETPTYDTARRMLLLRHMATNVYKRTADIVAAPPRITLARFGGSLSIDEFRKTRVQVSVVAPPFVAHMHYMESAIKQGITAQDVVDMKVEPAGERGLYFDFLKNHEQPEEPKEVDGSLSRFLRRSE